MSSNTPRVDSLERNLIINGNFDFWQRGTSFSQASNNQLVTADRFRVQNTNASAIVASQSTDVPTVAQSGYQSLYSLLITNNASGLTLSSGDFVAIRYAVEGQDYQNIHARNARLQFWVKSSVTGTYSLSFNNSAATRAYVTTYSITAANTWQQIVVDLPLDTAGTWNFDNTSGLVIRWTLGSGSSNESSTLNTWQTASGGALAATTQTTTWATTASATFELAQVMLIPQNYTNAVSTTVSVPFQRCGRSIGHELQMCQRYYIKSFDLATAPASNIGTLTGSTEYRVTNSGAVTAAVTVMFPTRMRTEPTITFYCPKAAGSTWWNNSQGVTSGTAALDITSEQGFTVFNPQTSGDAIPNGCQINWTADAEL